MKTKIERLQELVTNKTPDEQMEIAMDLGFAPYQRGPSAWSPRSPYGDVGSEVFTTCHAAAREQMLWTLSYWN